MKGFYDLDFLESQVFGAEASPDGEETEAGVEQAFLEEDEEPAADLIFTLTLEDDSRIRCRAAAVFVEQDREYVALETGGDQILIMELAAGADDSIQLLPVEDEKEQAAVFEAFLKIMGEGEEEHYDRDQDGEEN